MSMNSAIKTNLNSELEFVASIIQKKLSEIISSYRQNELYVDELSAVVDSAEYSLLAGGKRLRPFLAYAFCKLCDGNTENVLLPACALEMIHTYSLIHDDLPCMDNDDLRRGKPTNHIVFGEATAVLAGDALLTEAFNVVLNSQCNDPDKIKMIKILSSRSGILGMIGGQEIDLKSEGKTVPLDVLYTLQKKKTGMLFDAACLLGCISSENYTNKILDKATQFANSFGLAFQISDDILDVMGNEDTLGKPIGSDEKEKKYTFVTHLGVENATYEAKKHIELAKKSIKEISHNSYTDVICDLCDYILTRNK